MLFLNMRKYLAISSLLFTLLFLYGCPDDAKSKRAILEVTIEKFNNAFKNGDTAILETMITDNYRHSNGTSQAIDKKTWINYLKKRERQLRTGEFEIIEYKMDQIDMQLFDNSALVTGRVIVKSRKNDSITNNAYRVTHLWILEEGSWKRAGFHDGKIN